MRGKISYIGALARMADPSDDVTTGPIVIVVRPWYATVGLLKRHRLEFLPTMKLNCEPEGPEIPVPTGEQLSAARNQWVETVVIEFDHIWEKILPDIADRRRLWRGIEWSP